VRGVHILGVGATSFSGAERAGQQLVSEAVSAALADAGLRVGDVGTVALAGDTQKAIVLNALHRPGRTRPPVCAAGAGALHVAWQDVANGACDVALCVGLGRSVQARPPPVAALAAEAEAYMRASGATEEHLARVAAKNRAHGAHNPRVELSGPLDRRGVLASDVLAWPLRRLMVAEPSGGAAAVVLSTREIARSVGASGPRVLSSVLVREGAGGAYAASADAARLAYQVARVGPEDLDCAEIDDRSAAHEIAGYEALALVPEGHGPDLVDSGFTARGGVLPVNTSGGTLAQGDAAGASGLAQVCELAWQLRGDAGQRQVPGARTALALARGVERGGRPLASLTILGSG
jgi:acetyl-CoA acetyltransferase